MKVTVKLDQSQIRDALTQFVMREMAGATPAQNGVRVQMDAVGVPSATIEVNVAPTRADTPVNRR